PPSVVVRGDDARWYARPPAGDPPAPGTGRRSGLPTDAPASVLDPEHPGREASRPELETTRERPFIAARAAVRAGVGLDLAPHGGAACAPARPVCWPQVDPAPIGQPRVRRRLPGLRHDPDLGAAEQPFAVGQE